MYKSVKKKEALYGANIIYERKQVHNGKEIVVVSQHVYIRNKDPGTVC